MWEDRNAVRKTTAPGISPRFDLQHEGYEIPDMEIDPQVLAELCERNGIRRLRIFGSVARGDDSGASDIDLLAEFEGRKSLMDLVRIEREFAARLGRSVDLLTERSLSPYLRERILAESRLVYERAACVDFEAVWDTAVRDIPALKAELSKI